jgi:hypothetical protein
MLSHFHPTIGADRQDFATYLPIPPPSSTRGKDQPLGPTCLGGFLQ